MLDKYITILCAQKRPWRFLISRVLMRTKLCTFFTINRGRFLLNFYPSALSAQYWIDGPIADDDENFVFSYVKYGDCVVDVGANIGVISLSSSIAAGTAGNITAIEAHPRVYKYLCGNIKLNNCRNIVAINAAVGNSVGSLKISDSRADNENFVNSHSGVEINIKTLDSLFAPTDKRIALLKIDVEGYEKYVLQGAENTLSITDCIYIEFSEKNCGKYGYSCSEVAHLIKAKGFLLFRKTDTVLEQIADTCAFEGCQNLIALRNTAEFTKRTGWKIKILGKQKDV